ncbi:bumetanide-sensitive sodium-(potassium)-chloride cotransporter isoform X2 [Harmonia axyridis]|uniref:bumetanide-sensitive sodium-(potassium)-chloride cotransporter isoform X2 n=1 Tax=Harmonia axyridis TaxID=115357 RepID=UPI001E27797D|nr:bumetanide-sensitive sodium-(potassium)-chloride cotransporter isoform X2 [Harmonia axyridis]
MTDPGSKPNGGLDNAAFELREKCVVINETDKVPELSRNTNFNGFLVDQNMPRRKKSLVQMTREALPRLENYRNSRRAIKRPSLGELHGGDDFVKIGVEKDPNGNTESIEKQGAPSHEGIKLGWIQGVLIPCLLNIWGVMLFLRVSWVVAEAGIGGSLIIIGISALVCVVTTLSLSAISTNGEVKGGGIYYIISRSLGPEFGASVGIVFAFANAVSASINTIGFCNSLSELLKHYGVTLIDGGVNDTRVVGLIAIIIMIMICAIGMEWESKAQNFLIAIILAAMADFMVGTVIGPTTDEKRAQGFVGFNMTVFQDNWDARYRPHDGVVYDFFQVFAVFFPSVTGIQAGANISGDLKDPASAIPKGTFLALVISMISYALFVLFAGGAALRDANGNVSDLIYGNITSCPDPHCEYGLYNSYQMMTIMSSWDLLIYAGCFAATLSTALTNLLSVPRLIQALGIDKIYPGLIFFSKGYGKSGEPYRGYFLTFIVSGAFLLIAEINEIAPLISNFYLASYALINFCTFHAAFVKPLGWRPTFKYYNMWLSLAGFVTCVVIMFMINWQSSLVTFIVILGLYLVVVYRKPDVNWGSSTQAQTYKTALGMALRLNNIGEHVKNYKPQILVLSGSPKARPPLVDFANLITRSNSLLILGDVKEKRIPHRTRATRMNSVYAWLRTNKIKGFYTIVDNMKFEEGSKALMQSSGIGKLSPNVLMLGYKNNWMTCNRDDLLAYFNILHAAFDYRLSVTILRVEDGLDYSRITEDDESTGDSDSVKSSADLVEIRKKKKEALSKYLRKNSDLNKSMGIEKMMLFRTKQNKGNIDVWWLYDDGGLTMLLPYIISSRQDWESCKLRIFALATNMHILEEEKANMANLLTKFRLEYSSLEMVSLSDKPKDDTIEFFNELLKDFKTEDTQGDEARVSEQEILALQEKTYRQLRLRELLLEKSKHANLVVMSLPMPRKGIVSAPLYMAWLEALTRDLPPYLLVRGNQQSVLTFYS